jgi:peroxiredoxin Q/BCP
MVKFAKSALLVTFLLAGLVGARPAGADMIAVGDAFPTWEMQDQSGKKLSSADMAGKSYLLWYYPKAMTSGCTAEGQALRDAHPQFVSRGVEILGVSFDDPKDNAAFAQAENFPYRLLSDDGALAVQVGAATSRKQGYARRISYLVGPDGKVLQAYGSVSPSRHASQVLADIPGG